MKPTQFQRFAQEAQPILNRIESLKGQQSNRHRLAEYHRLGQLMVKLTGDRAAFGKGIVSKLARAIGWPADRAFRIRKLAIAYESNELQELARLAPQAPLTFFVRLAGVADEKKRKGLAKRMGDGATTGQLYREIRSFHRSDDREAGRSLSREGRPVRHRTAIDAIRELQQRVESLRRLWLSCRSDVIRRQRAAQGLPAGGSLKAWSKETEQLVQAIGRLKSEIRECLKVEA
jgi:hypothetical protein